MNIASYITTAGIVLERLSIVALAGLSTYLGWRLFYLDLQQRSDATIEHRGLRVTLRNVGPGVFFALFGSVILAFSLINPISINVGRNGISSSGVADRDTPSYEVRGIASHAASHAALADIQALNNAIYLGTLSKNEKRPILAAVGDLSARVNNLRQLRDRLLSYEIGTDNVGLWKKYEKTFKNDPAALSHNIRSKLRTLMKWFQY